MILMMRSLINYGCAKMNGGHLSSVAETNGGQRCPPFVCLKRFLISLSDNVAENFGLNKFNMSGFDQFENGQKR